MFFKPLLQRNFVNLTFYINSLPLRWIWNPATL